MRKHKRTYNPNLVRKTVSYSTSEIAELFGIHKITVLAWLRQGLPRIDKERPFLVLGAHLKSFLRERRSRRKKKCCPDELYCLHCRRPQKSIKGEVILVRLNAKVGRLSGICTTCGGKINRIISLRKFEEIRKSFRKIRFRDKDLIGLGSPDLNVNLKQASLT